jgi:hypothetical protein
MNDDSLLREQFARQRRAEEASAPRFEEVIGLARRRRNPGIWRLAMAASITLAAVTIAVTIAMTIAMKIAVPVMTARMRHQPQPPTSQPPTIAAANLKLADWRSPTDFLLDTPGRELLDTVPDIGRKPSMRLDPFPPTRMTIPAHRAGLEHS